MTRPNRLTVGIMLSLTFATSGCGPVRETVRLTYDPAKVAPGVQRSDIEREIGAPASTNPLPDGKVEDWYPTGRVTPNTKTLLQSTAIAADLMTAGLFEALRVDSSPESDLKSFEVIYGADNSAISIVAHCEAAVTTVVPIRPQGDSYLNCTAIDGKG